MAYGPIGLLKAIFSDLRDMFKSQKVRERKAVWRNARNRHDEPRYSPAEIADMYEPWDFLSEEEWEARLSGEKPLDDVTSVHTSPHPDRFTGKTFEYAIDDEVLFDDTRNEVPLEVIQLYEPSVEDPVEINAEDEFSEESIDSDGFDNPDVPDYIG